MVARCAFFLPFQLGWERATADTGAIGFGDAQHVVQQVRADARASRRIASHAVAGSDERIRTVIHIQERSLRAFKQQVHAGFVGIVQLARHVGHHGFDEFGLLHRIRVDRLKLQSRRA